MRGLTHMIQHKSNKNKKIQMEDQDLVREAFMDKKKKEEWNEEEIRKFNEYQKKEKEINDKKEKIRSQNLTKLNNHKMDIENIKSDLDMKFIKIYKKKLYFDYKICEQELCILALLRTMDYRQEVKNKVNECKEKYEKLKENEEIAKRNYNNFENNFNRLNEKKKEIEEKYATINKAPAKALDQLEKAQIDGLSELTQSEKDLINKNRNDPFFYIERERYKNSKKFGNKNYKEIKSTSKTTDDGFLLINRRYYVNYIFIFSINTNTINSQLIEITSLTNFQIQKF